jgi:hypothetical protein
MSIKLEEIFEKLCELVVGNIIIGVGKMKR